MAKPLADMETLFKALADATRLRILGLLLTGEVCVCDIHESLKIPQPKASRHLAYLRRAGLVETRREGLWVHYRLGKLGDPVLAAIDGRRASRTHPHRPCPSRRGATAEANRVLRAGARRRGRRVVLHSRAGAGEAGRERGRADRNGAPRGRRRRRRLVDGPTPSARRPGDHLRTMLVAREGGHVVGSAALEMYADGALLRSVVVAPGRQRQGLGRQLTGAAIRLAIEREAPAIYLLTTTAAGYFPKFGFERITRADVPAGVRTSVEFTSACPSSALVLKKRLSPR